MEQAGFPPGIVNLVTGSGSDVGDAIVDNPDVPVISFTGSSATGRSIAERAGRRLKRLSLELGGKNAVVVMRDADLDLAVDGILWSAFGTTGQRCTACSRVIADRPIADELVARLESKAKVLRLGSGLDEAVEVGPLINARRPREGRAVHRHRPRRGRAGDGGARATDGDLLRRPQHEVAVGRPVAARHQLALGAADLDVAARPCSTAARIDERPHLASRSRPGPEAQRRRRRPSRATSSSATATRR